MSLGATALGGRMDRCIAAATLASTAMVLLCLLAVVTLFTAADELRDITPGYGSRDALLYIFYSTPRRIAELLPYAVFIGALIGLGLLAGRSELTVLRAAGVSLARLFQAAALPAAALLALNLLLAEFAAPAGEAVAATLKLEAARGRGGYIDAAGWVREGDLATSIDGYGTRGELLGVRQFEFANGRLRLGRQAARARYLPEAGHWLLLDVRETRFGDDALRVRRIASLPWRSDLSPRLLSARALFDPAKLSFADLRFQMRYRQREGLDATRYAVAFWRKAFEPAAVLGLVLLALAFVVGPLRESGIGARLSVGIAVGLAFKYLLDVFAPIGIVFALPAWLAMAVPLAACWLAGGLLIRRAG